MRMMPTASDLAGSLAENVERTPVPARRAWGMSFGPPAAVRFGRPVGSNVAGDAGRARFIPATGHPWCRPDDLRAHYAATQHSPLGYFARI